MTKSQIFTAAHKLAKKTVAKYNSCNYAATFGACLAYFYANPVETKKEYYLNIPFGEKKDQKRAKQYLAAKWNPSTKSWIVVTTLKQIKECGLSTYIVKDGEERREKRSLGNFGTGCITTKRKAQIFGFDAIEK